MRRVGELCRGVTGRAGSLRVHAAVPTSRATSCWKRPSPIRAGTRRSANADVWVARGGAVLVRRRRRRPHRRAAGAAALRAGRDGALPGAHAVPRGDRAGDAGARGRRHGARRAPVRRRARDRAAGRRRLGAQRLRLRAGGPRPRGRRAADGDRSTSGRPAFRLGIAEIEVGWTRRTSSTCPSPPIAPTYRVRDTAARHHHGADARGGAPPPAGSEVAVAVVDEGLLALSPNRSWDLLRAMLGRRGYGVRTATAQLEVVGKRHYGQKAAPPRRRRRPAADARAVRHPAPVGAARRAGRARRGARRDSAQRLAHQLPRRGRRHRGARSLRVGRHRAPHHAGPDAALRAAAAGARGRSLPRRVHAPQHHGARL